VQTEVREMITRQNHLLIRKARMESTKTPVERTIDKSCSNRNKWLRIKMSI